MQEFFSSNVLDFIIIFEYYFSGESVVHSGRLTMTYNCYKRNLCTLIYLIFVLLVFLSCTGNIGRRQTAFYSQDHNKLQHYAESFLDTPYLYGGADRSGMDCSGLVVRIFQDIYGMTLPHSTQELNKKGRSVHLRSAEIGDLVFFREHRRSPPSHVGIYLGENTFIHVSSSQGVIISSLENPYYQIRFYEMRRII